MDLNGKNVIILGDSLTEGYGVNDYNNVFHQRLKKSLGIKKLYPCAVSGTKIARIKTPGEFHQHDLYFRLRAEVMPLDADLVIVFGGTNDYGQGYSDLGNINSTNDYDFYGALNNLVVFLKERYVNSRIVLMTPLHREDEMLLNDKSYILEDYVKAIRDVSKKHNVGLIDLFGDLDLSPNDSSLVPDGLHPNDLGHRVLAEFIAEKIKNI